MQSDFVGVVLAFAIGVAIATINYMLSRWILKKRPTWYALMQIVKQWIQIAYMIVLFVFGKYTPWDPVWLLVGGTLGVTIPMFLYTYLLVKFNDSLKRKEASTDG